MPPRRDILASMGAVIATAGCVGVPPDERGDETDGADGAPNRSTGSPPPDPAGTPSNASGDAEDDQDGPPQRNPLDDFEDLSHWEVIDGSLHRDTDVAAIGDACARIEVDADQVRAAIRAEFAEAMDLSGLHPHLAVRSEETCYPRIRLHDDSGDYLEFRAVVRGGLQIQPVEFGISEVVGAPTLPEVRRIEFSQYVGSGERARFWIDDLRVSERLDPGVILIHFDDSLRTDFTEALPVLETYDMTAATFVNPDYLGREVGGKPRLTLDQLVALDEAGWDVGSHTRTHTDLAAADRATVEREVASAKEWLVEHGFENGARYFVYPYASYDQTAIDIVLDHHDVAFGSGWPATGRCRNPALVPRALGDGSFEAAKRVIDLTARFGGISTIFYHHLSGEQRRTFERTMSYLAARRNAGDVRVSSVSDVASSLLANQGRS